MERSSRGVKLSPAGEAYLQRVAGALGAIDEVARLKPAQVLYVSCNPTTFARDAKVLLAKGYRLDKIGMMDMFPYTSHLELMALFSHTRQ